MLTKVEISNTTHWGYGGWVNSVNKSGNIKYHSLGVRGLGTVDGTRVLCCDWVCYILKSMCSIHHLLKKVKLTLTVSEVETGRCVKYRSLPCPGLQQSLSPEQGG